MRRLAVFVTTAALIVSVCSSAVYAISPESNVSAQQKKVVFYLKPDISVELNGVRQTFRDANGQAVYPIIYNGTTYLPVRAVSALMKEPVEWNAGSKTVYIGKTLANPIKSSAQIPTECAAPANESDLFVAKSLKPGAANGYSKPDIIVMYDFAVQTFKDANGMTVYPLNYSGSTYLPIRAISRLMNEPITWDGSTQKITIGDGKEEEPVVEPDKESDTAFAELKELYENEEALYYEASAKITNIKNATLEQKQSIAESASENYLKAQSLTTDVKEVDQDSFSDEEQAAYDKLLAFAESNEYYILVLENIAYLAASDSDYSMLADTFLYFALDAQSKMGEAKELIITL